MSSARHTLDMTMYELADPRAVSILEADAARGVRVRVLLDKDYSGSSVNQGAVAQLAGSRVQVRWAYAGEIFHQKTITVDGRTSAVMTLNLTSRYYAADRDFAVITTDQPDVAAIERVFDTDWTGSGAPAPGPSGQDLVWSPGAATALVSLIDSAHTSLLVENEEMDNPQVITALQSAARRGVDVEVVMTDSSSWTGAFDELVRAGVHVRTYSADAATYIHAKVIVADDATLYLGSQNFSTASLDYNRELGLIITRPALVTSVYRTVQSDFAGATVFAAPETTAPARSTSAAASCRASAVPASDGYSGDYDIRVTSNRPDTEATANDANDHWSHRTNGSGDVVIRLWHTSPGESITVTVGGATCSTTA